MIGADPHPTYPHCCGRLQTPSKDLSRSTYPRVRCHIGPTLTARNLYRLPPPTKWGRRTILPSLPPLLAAGYVEVEPSNELAQLGSQPPRD